MSSEKRFEFTKENIDTYLKEVGEDSVMSARWVLDLAPLGAMEGPAVMGSHCEYL